LLKGQRSLENVTLLVLLPSMWVLIGFWYAVTKHVDAAPRAPYIQAAFLLLIIPANRQKETCRCPP
jgi:hypothetical protein